MKKHKLIGFILLLLPLQLVVSQEMKLQEKVLLDNQITLKIPMNFSLMSEEMLTLKYPSSSRPTIVYANESGSVNVALNLTESRGSQSMIKMYKTNFEQMFRDLYPSAKWHDTGVKEINGRKVGFLKVITPAVDTEIYNVIFLTNLKEKLLLCTFNCTLEQMPKWKETANSIMTSLQIN